MGADRAACPELDSLRQEAYSWILGAGSGDGTSVWGPNKCGDVALSCCWLQGTRGEVGLPTHRKEVARHGSPCLGRGVPVWLHQPAGLGLLAVLSHLPSPQGTVSRTALELCREQTPPGAGMHVFVVTCLYKCKSLAGKPGGSKTSQAAVGVGGSLIVQRQLNTCMWDSTRTASQGLRQSLLCSFSRGTPGTERPIFGPRSQDVKRQDFCLHWLDSRNAGMVEMW